MKFFNKYFTLLTVLFLILSINVYPQHPKDLKKPAPITFKPLKPAEFSLSNGVKVFYLQNKELPLITFGGIIKAGRLYDPENKIGLSALAVNVIRSGGTKTFPGDKIDEELEYVSATIQAEAGQEYTTFAAECLTKDFKRVAMIFADLLKNPEFPQQKIDLAKKQIKEGMRRRWDQPNRAAEDIFNEKVYNNNIYGKRTTYASINSISREDMIEFHKNYFAPNNLTIYISGDISLLDAKIALEGVFKSWTKKEVKFPTIPELVEKCDGSIYYAFNETPQANIFLGHLGIRRNSPDQYKVELLNTILGGGFTARLMKELRSNRGLTYGIRGGVFSGKDKGLFQISSQLKAEKCVEALNLIKNIIKEMQETSVTDQEIEQAKNYISNSFVFRFDQKDRYLNQYVMYKLNGFPDNYLEKYLDNIKKISKKDIQDAAKKYLDPEKMIIVIVGDEKKFDKPLSTFGQVIEYDMEKTLKSEISEK